MPYSSKVQQRLGAKLPPEPLERMERPGVGDLGIDVHRHVDLRMAQDPHSNPRMHVERGQKSGTGMPHVVHGDTAQARLGAACLETTVQVPRFEWRTGPGREHQPASDPGGVCRSLRGGLVLRGSAMPSRRCPASARLPLGPRSWFPGGGAGRRTGHHAHDPMIIWLISAALRELQGVPSSSACQCPSRGRCIKGASGLARDRFATPDPPTAHKGFGAYEEDGGGMAR